MRLRTFGLLTMIAMVAAACITEQRAILFITLDQVPPDTVDVAQLTMVGAVVRDPPDPNAFYTVRAINTNSASVDTVEVRSGSVGVFSITVPIRRDTVGIVNQIVITATDDTDESLSDERPFQVVGLVTGPALRWDHR